MSIAACTGPSLDVPVPQASLSVELDPLVEPDAVALNFRGRVHPAPARGAPWLFLGEVSDYYDRALRRGEVPAALRGRAVPLRYWRDADSCWLQPVVWLEPDASYTLAFEGTGRLRQLRARVGAEPRAARLFPSPGRSKHRVAVVCDTKSFEPLLEPTTLEPGGIALAPLASMAGLLPGCVTLVAAEAVPDVTVSRPLLGGVLLDPAPWLPPPPTPQLAPVRCAGQRVAAACLEALDDRLIITPEREEQLWLVDTPTRAVVSAAAGSRTALLRGLESTEALALHATVLSSAGRLDVVETMISTANPRRHLILNEVLADPLGAEVSSEWIELVNDSRQPASLAGIWLEDAAGHVPLPVVVLEPGEHTLLVAESFRPSSLDVPVPDNVRLVRLPSLGTRGLANGGEALLLVGVEGVLSRFPQLAASHAGRSIARRTLDSADDDAGAFAEHGGTGASPGAPNSFEAPTGGG
jgi:hypothetical protein